jgi:hypothetical protein
LRGFWKRRSWIGKTAIIVGAVLVVLVAIGLAVPATDNSDNKSAAATTEAVTTTPAGTTEEAATTPEATTQEASDEDTGRMSEREFEEFSGALTEVDQEVQQFATTMQKCGVLFQALQLADASDCVDEAYSGFEDKVSFASFTVDDLNDDVAKECLQTMSAYGTRLNRFGNYVANLHEAGANLQAEKFLRIAKRAKKETRRYAAARDLALIACAPT